MNGEGGETDGQVGERDGGRLLRRHIHAVFDIVQSVRPEPRTGLD